MNDPIRRQRVRGASEAKVWLIIVTVVAIAAGAVAWVVMKRRAEIRVQTEAAYAVLNERRLEMFGDRVLAPGIEFRPSGLGIRILEPGEGPTPGLSDTIRMTYKGSLKDGQVFDQALEPADFPLGRLVPGMATGLQLLRPGGRMEIFIPPSLGYGNQRVAGIAPGSGLIFDVSLIAVNP